MERLVGSPQPLDDIAPEPGAAATLALTVTTMELPPPGSDRAERLREAMAA